MHQHTARQLILTVAAVYLGLVGCIELARLSGVLHTLTADEGIQSLTTLASLTVGSILGVYLAFRQRHS